LSDVTLFPNDVHNTDYINITTDVRHLTLGPGSHMALKEGLGMR